MEPPTSQWLVQAQVTWNWHLQWDRGSLSSEVISRQCQNLRLSPGNARIELNCRTSSWHLRIARCRKDLHTFGDQKYSELSVEQRRKTEFLLHYCTE